MKILSLWCLLISLLLVTMNVAAQEPIVIAGSQWPPFEYQEEGVNKGSDVEIVLEAFKRMNVPVEIKFYPWKRCEMMAQTKNVDGIFTLRKTPEREEFLIFPDEPVNYSENVFFYKTGKTYTFNGALEDLKGLQIGVTAGYQYGDEFMQSSLFTLQEANADDQNFEKLIRDRMDLFICDKLVGVYLLKQLELSEQITYLPTYYSRFEMFVGFSKKEGHEKLAQEFSEALRSMKADGTYQRILDAYLK